MNEYFITVKVTAPDRMSEEEAKEALANAIEKGERAANEEWTVISNNIFVSTFEIL